MLQASFELGLSQARLNSSVALPLTIPALSNGAISTVSVTVPDNELWNVSFAGFFISVSLFPATLTAQSSLFLTNKAGQAPWSGQSNAASVITPISTGILLVPANAQIQVFLNLQGVQLQRGDSFFGTVFLQNGSGAGIDVTQMDGMVRFTQIRLVSEMAVAGLQASRQDQLLDLRLRQSRG